MSVKTEKYKIGVIFPQLRGDLFIAVDLFMHHKHSGSNRIDNDLIFVCGAFSFTFILGEDSIFVFDPHSYCGEVSMISMSKSQNQHFLKCLRGTPNFVCTIFEICFYSRSVKAFQSNKSINTQWLFLKHVYV